MQVCKSEVKCVKAIGIFYIDISFHLVKTLKVAQFKITIKKSKEFLFLEKIKKKIFIIFHTNSNREQKST